MKRNRYILGALICLIIAAGVVNTGFLWSICLISVLLYVEMRALELKDFVETKDAIMGNRIIEGMKALTSLCQNVFDHLKTHKQQIEKINAKVGDHTVKLHQFDRRQHRVVGQRSKESRYKVQPQENRGVERQKFSPKTNTGRADRKAESTPKNVPNAEHKS